VLAEHSVLMDTLAKKLKERAEQMGVSNAEAARIVGLDERRYAHYASGRREPDLATLVKIGKALNTTPNWLLGVASGGETLTKRGDLLDRLTTAGQGLPDSELKSLIIQAEALAAMNRRRK
jgi:transcriptional regulator with XRE-family HTH domain